MLLWPGLCSGVRTALGYPRTWTLLAVKSNTIPPLTLNRQRLPRLNNSHIFDASTLGALSRCPALVYSLLLKVGAYCTDSGINFCQTCKVFYSFYQILMATEVFVLV